MKSFKTAFGAASIALLLAGCSSAPSYFYTLEPMAPEQAQTPAPMNITTPVVVASFTLPHVLDRPQFVLDAGDNQLDVSSTDRWAAPLDEMAAQVLAQDLAGLLPANLVVPTNQPMPKGKIDIVSVDASRFIGGYDGSVTLNAYWTISAGDPPTPVTRKTAEITIKSTDNTYNGTAAAMSQALADLAGQIAGSLH